MRNFVIIAVFLFVVQNAVSQTFMVENFDSGQWPPWGWSIENDLEWKKSATNYAEGNIPEARLTISDNYGGSKFISKEINLEGYNSIKLIFKNFVEYHSGEYTLKVSTQSGRGSWHEVWSMPINEAVDPSQIVISIANQDVGMHDFRFSFHVEGSTATSYDYWYIDNINVIYNPVLDCSMETILTNEFVDKPSVIKGVIKNNGITTVNSVEVFWKEESGELFSTIYENLSIDTHEEFNFECKNLFSTTLGSYDVEVAIGDVNGVMDDNPDNNSLVKTINMVCHISPKRPYLESFVSSNSTYCATFNNDFNPWADSNKNNITYVKYPVNWPVPGDPYFIHEFGVRTYFYDIVTSPSTVINGVDAGGQFSRVRDSYNNSIDDPSVFNIASSFSVVGTNVEVNTNILSYFSISDVDVYVTIFEETTTENVGSNGESEFKHIAMKMVPDADGSSLSFVDRQPESLSLSIDMLESNIEDFDDLGVSVFIQDYDSKYIYQSNYSQEDAVFNNDATLSDLIVDGITIEGFDPYILDYIYELSPDYTTLPEVTAITNDSNAISIILSSQNIFAMTTVEVFAEDLITKNTYTIGFVLPTNINKSAKNNSFIYPNPSNGIININSTNIDKIVVFDKLGSIVYKEDNCDSSIDLSGCSTGVYYLKLISNNTVNTQSIVITK